MIRTAKRTGRHVNYTYLWGWAAVKEKHACKCINAVAPWIRDYQSPSKHTSSHTPLCTVTGRCQDLRSGLPSWVVQTREHCVHSSSCLAPYNLKLNLKSYSCCCCCSCCCMALYGLKHSPISKDVTAGVLYLPSKTNTCCCIIDWTATCSIGSSGAAWTNYWLFFMYYHYFPEGVADATGESLLVQPEHKWGSLSLNVKTSF